MTPKVTPDKVLAAADTLRWEAGTNLHDALMESIYADAGRIADRAVTRGDETQAFRLDRTIDRLVTSRWLGFPFMLLVLAVVFWLTIEGANLPSGMLATLLLGEQITRARVTAITFGVAGVILILRPGLAVISPASLAVLGGAFCYATSHTLTRKLAQVDTPLAILFYMTLIQLPLGFVTSILDWATPSMVMLPWIIVVGVTALSGHYCMARALALADAIVVVPMDFLRLPLIAGVGALIYHEPLDWLVLAGGGVMFTGNLINIRAEEKRNRNKI